MILIAGLGNPGVKYYNTRHNVGFIMMNILANAYNLVWKMKPKLSSEIAIGSIQNCKFILCKPNNYMNLSGESILSIVSYFKINLNQILIFHDDINLQFNEIKYKIGGSSGGHNGIKSIDARIGVEYHRIRIGVGRPADNTVSKHVLSDFSKNEEVLLKKKLNIFTNLLHNFCSGDYNKFHLDLIEKRNID